MKKSIILVVAFAIMSFTANAQGHMVVDSEKVFTSVKAYTDAIEQLDKLSEAEQKKVDDAFANLETKYNNYQSIKSRITSSDREKAEATILLDEKAITDYQEKVFGLEGDIMKKRIELIKPIQDRVFATITKYATDNKFTLVLDITANPSVLYSSPAIDKTDEIIKLVK